MTRLLKNVSIKRKLTLVTMLTSGAALIVACALFGVYDYVTYRQTLVKEMSTMADLVGGNSTAALSFDDRESATQILARLHIQSSIVNAALFDARGQQFASYERAGSDGAAACGGDAGVQFATDVLTVVRTIALAGEKIGVVCVQSDLSELRARLQGYGVVLAVVILVSSLTALLMSTAMQGLISGPILRLA